MDGAEAVRSKALEHLRYATGYEAGREGDGEGAAAFSDDTQQRRAEEELRRQRWTSTKPCWRRRAPWVRGS